VTTTVNAVPRGSAVVSTYASGSVVSGRRSRTVPSASRTATAYDVVPVTGVHETRYSGGLDGSTARSFGGPSTRYAYGGDDGPTSPVGVITATSTVTSPA
jgi:hypothetical protein